MIVTYRTGDVLLQCLDRCCAQPEVAEVVLVDNGNPPRMVAMLDRLAAAQAKIRVVRPGRNMGFAAACNLGARLAGGPYLAFVNPDLIPPPDTFARFGAVMAASDGTALLGGRLLNLDGSEQQGGRRDVLTPWRAFVELTRLDRLAPHHPHFRRFVMMDGSPPDSVVEVPTISGAIMVMDRDRYLALGGMDERMFLHMEDVDLCLRWIAGGGRVLYCGNVPVHHLKGSSDVSRGFVEWHKTRSTTHYFFKHFSSSYPAWSLRLIAAMLWVRFGFAALRALPADAARLLRRAGRGGAGAP